MSTLIEGKDVKVLPFSWSSLQSFETCPRRHYALKTKQAFDTSDSGLKEGNEVHLALEKAVAGTRALPESRRKFIPIVEKFKSTRGRVVTEQEFAIDKGFKPTEYWGPDAWYRGKLDLQIVRTTHAYSFDYKTGKVKEDKDKYAGQLALTAAVTFAQEPQIMKVTTAYLWLAHDKISTEIYTKGDVPIIWQEFLPRVKRMVHAADTHTFKPTPSGLCAKYCPLRQSQCEFSGKP